MNKLLVSAPFVRAEFNYDMDAASKASGLRCEDESLAVQSAAEETDINTIVRRFGLSGQLPSDVRAPTYGDFSEVVDFRTAMEAIRLARESFESMPALVRTRFHNDPGEFVDFCSDEKNRDEAIKLGLIVPAVLPPVPEPVLVRLAKEDTVSGGS